jgi:hypothetical protein
MLRSTRPLRRLRRLRGLLLALACAGAVACASPTLPLPPPTAPSMVTGSAPDTVKLTSLQGAEPNAVIIVINRNTDLPRDQRVSGTISDEQGSWELEVTARPGDLLDIAQDNGTVRSPHTTVTVR